VTYVKFNKLCKAIRVHRKSHIR